MTETTLLLADLEDAVSRGRFNITVCEDTRGQSWLQRQSAGEAADPSCKADNLAP